jgi:hypothetical protein
VLVAFVALTRYCCGSGYGGLLQLNLWDVVEGWLCGFGDGGKGLSGWLLEWRLVLIGSLD